MSPCPVSNRRACLRILGSVLAGYSAPSALWAADVSANLHEWPSSRPTPALDAVDLHGQRWSTGALRGVPTLLNFWASWCQPCLTEMPTLMQLADFHGPQALRVLAINFKEPPMRVRRFSQSIGLNVPVLLDPLGDVAKGWGVNVFPTTILIDRYGRVRQLVRGEVDWTSAQALAWVDRLMAF